MSATLPERMNPLKINITGVRGIVGETLTPHLVTNFAQAFGTYAGGGKVFLCNDARRSAPMVVSAVISGLLSTGCEPVDFGVCPTPSMQFSLANAGGAAGGIAVSAGHNPEDWNALRFLRKDGMYLNTHQAEELLDIYHAAEFSKSSWDKIKKLGKNKKPLNEHIQKIIGAFDSQRIRKRGFKVVVDTCNGACGEAAPRLLEALGCEVVCLHDEPGRPFPHNPEPSIENMQTLRTIVTATNSDIGFMLDSAGERLGIVTETGDALAEDSTLPLCAAMRLVEKKGIIVTNLSTTRAIDDIAKRNGSTVVRTLIGQAYVAEAAMKSGAAIAGEGSGGVIIPAVQFNNDSLAAMAFILHNLARGRATVSSVANSLPKYIMKKKKIEFPPERIFTAIQRARTEASHNMERAKVSFDDGVKADWADSWLHIRPSNTESLIRIIAEAKTEFRADKLIEMGSEMALS